MTETRRRLNPDALAVLALVLLWLLFFWRIFTPVAIDQASFKSGDFSGQFVAFAGYQYDRFTDGHVPLWNPYNNGGLPFIGDTQAAALYPPRLLTIGLSNLTGGWLYASLEYEVAAHVLIYTLVLYTFVRRLTRDRRGTHLAATAAAIVGGYGGFLTGYPPLQVALLEAACWLPLALLGVLEATRGLHLRWGWLALAGFGLGLSWMAGHPQTSWFATYFVTAYLIYRGWRSRLGWARIAFSVLLMGLVTIGVTAIHLLPGLEYLQHTSRPDMDFDAKSGGFAFWDVTTFVYPRVFWTPLYFGAVGFGLALTALAGNGLDRLFWLSAALVALLVSFGGDSPLFHAFYNLLPGLRYFRGQERAVFVVANSAAILVGLGILTLYTLRDTPTWRAIRRGWLAYAGITGLVTGVVFLLTLIDAEAAQVLYGRGFLPAIVVVLASYGLVRFSLTGRPLWLVVIVALLTFELFSVNMDNRSTYDPIPPTEQTSMEPGPLLEPIQDDDTPAFRVDGGLTPNRIGLPPGGNTGSLYGIPDIRGISPLFLSGPHAIIMRESPVEVAWEVFSVKYVVDGRDSLPRPSTVITQHDDLKLHRLDDPRPFAHLVYDATVAPGDAFARQVLADPAFDARSTAILESAVSLDLPETPPDESQASVTTYRPEHFSIEASTSTNAILTVSHVDYPGWQVTVNGEPVETIRAYGAVTAVPLPAGEHTITFHYNPLSYRIGALLSLVTWAGLGILGGVMIVRRIFRRTS